MIERILSASLLLVLLVACSHFQKGELLYGQWKGAEWTVDGAAGQFDPTSVSFEFRPDGTYTARYGNQEESGTWWLEADKLFTSAEGQQTKKVRILQLSADTVVFDMNRAGVAEKLTLVKTGK